MRKKIVAGNWKMNKSLQEAQALTNELTALLANENLDNVQVIICVPSIYLTTISTQLSGNTKVAVGAQNCHQKASGAYTGEISAAMLASAAIPYVLVGHSERRQYFGEDDVLLAEKTKIALENNLTPIFCCGESLDQRQNQDYLAIVKAQITASLFDLSTEDFGKVVIAYEPIWAIGTGLTASSAQAQEMHAELRTHVASKYGQTVADDCTILYGGSCNEKNADELFACPDVDGGLIGGASLKASEFVNIIKARNAA